MARRFFVVKARLAKMGVALLPAFVVGALLFVARAPTEAEYASDQALEAALLAPCCYNGTLTTHDSELAHDLRGEIEHRHAGGESLSHIEKDMVDRYGERVLAMPNQHRFVRSMLAAAVAALALAAFIAAYLRRSRRDAPAVEAKPYVRDEWDDRIDEELLAEDHR